MSTPIVLDEPVPPNDRSRTIARERSLEWIGDALRCGVITAQHGARTIFGTIFNRLKLNGI